MKRFQRALDFWGMDADHLVAILDHLAQDLANSLDDGEDHYVVKAARQTSRYIWRHLCE